METFCLEVLGYDFLSLLAANKQSDKIVLEIFGVMLWSSELMFVGPMPILIEIAIVLSLINGILSPQHVS
jgi:hypothetical protein